ncbi:MAG: hypothetical protein KF726_18465 [Anaerolineae bacterium]|nr:hypothetical protein [Anaerolineae bacterium]
MKKIVVPLLIATALITPVHAGSQDAPARIRIERRDLLPEGIEYDGRNDRFLVSSMAQGTVFAVADDGTATPFIEDPDLIASIGLEIDHANGRLLVVNADLAVTGDAQNMGLSQLAIYDLDTGDRLHFVDLGSLLPDVKHFANDVTIDAEGNAYVTDSLAPVIYKVTPDGEGSIFLQDDKLLIDGFGGNGIVYHPDSFLIVGISGVELYKVPLANPASWTVIQTSKVIAADGMLLTPDDSLLVVNNGEIVALSSSDQWTSASVTEEAKRHPASAITLRDDAVYALHPQQNEIVRVRFQ